MEKLIHRAYISLKCRAAPGKLIVTKLDKFGVFANTINDAKFHSIGDVF
jgi:hypothetical protein